MKEFSLNIIKFIKEIVHIKLTVLMFTILPIAVLTLITFKTPLLFNFKSFIVLTGSMQPLIPAGSIVYTQKVSNYNIGDIISYEKAGVIITHRIFDIKREGGKIVYLTKGDANNIPDSDAITSDKIIGKAQFHFPYVGKLLISIRTLSGFLAFIIFPSIIFIGFELWNIKKELEKNIEERLIRKFKQNIPHLRPTLEDNLMIKQSLSAESIWGIN